MITQTDLDRAAAELTAAEADLAELRPDGKFGWLLGRESGTVRAARAGRVEQAAERLEALTARHAAEQADLADRPAREKAAAKFLTGAGKALDDSAARVNAAAEAAQAALVELLDAATAHDATVAQYGAELAAHGLPLTAAGGDHSTGGTRGAVRIKGRWHLGVDPGALAVHVLYLVAEARLGRVHGLTRTLRWWAGRPALDRRTDGLLSGLRAVPALKVATVTRPARGPLTAQTRLTRSDVQRAKSQLQRELTGWTEMVPDGSGGVTTRPCKAPQYMQDSVARRMAAADRMAAGT